MLIILPAFYWLSILIFSLIMLKVQENSGVFPRHFEMGLGYFWYLFVESFGYYYGQGQVALAIKGELQRVWMNETIHL